MRSPRHPSGEDDRGGEVFPGIFREVVHDRDTGEVGLFHLQRPGLNNLPVEFCIGKRLDHLLLVNAKGKGERGLRLAVRFITARVAADIMEEEEFVGRTPPSLLPAYQQIPSFFTSVTSPAFRIFSMNSRIVTTPALCKRVFHLKMVEHAGNDHVHEIIDGLRVVVEPGAGGHDRCTGLLGSKHVL